MNNGTDDTYFSAILTPHRSLSPRGFLILMAIISLICFVAGMIFFFMGAWPILGFFGLDVLIIYIAFKLNYRAGRAHELVDLTHDSLKVTRVSPSGKSQSWEFNPYWVRLELTEKDEYSSELSLTSHGRRLVFGNFLTKDEKQDFRNALSDALVSCKTPGT